MEIVATTPDQQGTRIHSVGGMRFFNESWMSKRSSFLFDDLIMFEEEDSYETNK